MPPQPLLPPPPIQWKRHRAKWKLWGFIKSVWFKFYSRKRLLNKQSFLVQNTERETKNGETEWDKNGNCTKMGRRRPVMPWQIIGTQPSGSYGQTCTSFYVFSGPKRLSGWVGYWTPTCTSQKVEHTFVSTQITIKSERKRTSLLSQNYFMQYRRYYILDV